MTSDEKWIAQVDFGEGQMSHGTRVILSDGSKLAGVRSVERYAEVGEAQEITVRVVRGEMEPASTPEQRLAATVRGAICRYQEEAEYAGQVDISVDWINAASFGSGAKYVVGNIRITLEAPSYEL